jgi:hypothetical protein
MSTAVPEVRTLRNLVVAIHAYFIAPNAKVECMCACLFLCALLRVIFTAVPEAAEKPCRRYPCSLHCHGRERENERKRERQKDRKREREKERERETEKEAERNRERGREKERWRDSMFVCLFFPSLVARLCCFRSSARC